MQMQLGKCIWCSFCVPYMSVLTNTQVLLNKHHAVACNIKEDWQIVSFGIFQRLPELPTLPKQLPNLQSLLSQLVQLLQQMIVLGLLLVEVTKLQRRQMIFGQLHSVMSMFLVLGHRIFGAMHFLVNKKQVNICYLLI